MKFDVAVVGGGHAGIEAAYVAAKKGLATVLISSSLDMIGQMSCNPAIGGISKGTIVREIDALGGVMGRATDTAGIHFKMLNQTKGMAVWGPRAQADKRLYRQVVRQELESAEKLFLFQGMVTGITCFGGKIKGLQLDGGQKIDCRAVIFCMGTFLNGVAHIGMNSFACGRTGEPPSLHLTESLVEHGIATGRLKTGTPPRLDGRTVDFDKLEEQFGDTDPQPFSFSNERGVQNKVSCWIGKTNGLTHSYIHENLDNSPLFTGKITSIGPKYCPSIEDKVVRFGERDGHTLFLEPEGVDLQEMYLNGLSTSLPFDIQCKMVNSIRGLEKARITRPGYAIEYDYFDPIQLFATLESKTIGNLFFAGQVNGTSGYEEAACQGLIAGINAAANILDEPAFVAKRETSYIGVLIDDLVTKGTKEPYRMFTSRAEYRLLLRQDNADERLMEEAFERGLIEQSLYEKRRALWERKNSFIEKLGDLGVTVDAWARAGKAPELRQTTKAAQLLKRPDTDLNDILRMTGICCEDLEAGLRAVADIRYSGFIEKQKKEIEKQQRYQNTPIPANFDYQKIEGLLNASQIELIKVQPTTIGQAARVPGITPADISVLLWHLVRNSE